MWVDARDQATITDVLGHSDLTVLCTPVKTIIDLLPLVLEQSEGWVTDCGSTKALTLSTARHHPRGQRFVPGHPMAGSPVGGLPQARADLFVDRPWILCPQGALPEAIELVTDLVHTLGGNVLHLEAEEHDHSVAWTSHLPQVVASALCVLASEQQARAAAGPGFASATRVAGGEPSMWRDIFETNGEEIASALGQMGSRLADLSQALAEGNTELLLKMLQEARRLR
jgi:prephenate dehydrogenase